MINYEMKEGRKEGRNGRRGRKRKNLRGKKRVNGPVSYLSDGVDQPLSSTIKIMASQYGG